MSIGQMPDTRIESFITYSYSLNCKDEIIMGESKSEKIKFTIRQDCWFVTGIDGNTTKVFWTYGKTSNPNTHTYYTYCTHVSWGDPIFTNKVVFNPDEKRIYYYYNYNKYMDNYYDVIVYVY